MKHEFSQGITNDGVAILMDGQPLTPDEIVKKLTEQQESIEVLRMVLKYDEDRRINENITYVGWL